jgi:hypothetical protein
MHLWAAYAGSNHICQLSLYLDGMRCLFLLVCPAIEGSSHNVGHRFCRRPRVIFFALASSASLEIVVVFHSSIGTGLFDS